jgi:hypothetical protein
VNRSIGLLTLVAFIVASVSLRPSLAANAPSRTVDVSPERVQAAIEAARKFIYSQQKDGTWEKVPKRDTTVNDKDPGSKIVGSQWGGQTALAVLALLAAGDVPQSDQLVKPIDFLMKADLIGTYAIGCRMQVMMLLPETPETKAVMRRDVERLMHMMRRKGAGKGFFGYEEKGSSYSLSRSQYAVLGMWAAEQSGQEVPGSFWQDCEKAWTAAQQKDGGWQYVPGGKYPETAGITAVGIASMFIIQDQLYGNRGSDCSKSVEIPAIEKGIDWLVKHYDHVSPATKMEREYPCPNLYAIERVGVAGGLKYFGKIDWYKEGAAYLLNKQKKDGSFGGGLSIFSDSCFATLFLSRGRAPVIFNKLDYIADAKEASGAWNRRPRDIANVTRWIGRSTERDFNWQIVNFEAPIADWHDAPILYLAGSDPIKLDKAHAAKIKQYIEEGGMVLAHADCGKSGFAASVRNLAQGLFPSYEFRELPENHPIYTSIYPRSKWKNKPSVLGLSNGVRELMVLIPQADPGKWWQIGVVRGREEQWQLAADIVFYASDQRSMRVKGESRLFAEDKNVKPTDTIKVARLHYNGNWDPEPGGWQRVRNMLWALDKLDADVEPVDLGSGNLAGYKLAHITGTTRFKLDAAAKAQLKKFIADGGTLLVDAAGGSSAFADAMEGEMESLGNGAKLETLPPDHSLFGGKDAIKVSYRTFGQAHLQGKLNVPHLKAVRVGARPAILFSREDLSAGMLGTGVGGIIGYAPASATDLVRRIVLRAAAKEPAPAKIAATQPKGKAVARGKATKSAKAAKPADSAAAGKPAAPPASSGDGLD